MTLIEGVGDEVVQFVGVLLVLAVAALAWWSTNARPDRYHTVLVMRSRAHHPVTVSIRTRSNMPITNAAGNSIHQASTSNINGISGISTETNEDGPGESSRVIPLQEMDSIVDADMAMMDNNRLHFYRRIDSGPHNQSGAESTSDESEIQEDVEPASNAQIREMDSIVSAMEADVTAGCEFFSAPSESSSSAVKVNKTTNDASIPSASDVNTPSEENPPEAAETEAAGDVTDGNSRKILIKLKYLNDTLKEVEGSLDELLKDFKWRHFSTELTSERRVRLIFNGRVLGDDAATLRALGLHHRAVVHCLVHPRRQPSQNRSASPAHSGGQSLAEAAPERAWDLENILMTLVSVALTVVWFFRCEYSNMFTASASVALFGLTVFYSVAIFGLYLSDTFHTDRRPQPIPNN